MKEERPTEEEASDGSSCDEAVHEPGDPARDCCQVQARPIAHQLSSQHSLLFAFSDDGALVNFLGGA